MDIQIVVLAAGLGRRFGGDKQLVEVGPFGEWLLDYALQDARLAGFLEAVLVVRPEMAAIENRAFPLPVKLAFQYEPLGTAHALWSARDRISGPFAVVNADDYYGRESYFQLAAFLREECRPGHYGLIGFPLEKTLSDSGPVSRAICQVDAQGYLIDIEEHTGLIKSDPTLLRQSLVSMNSWALHPDFLEFLEEAFPRFLKDKKGEWYLPSMIREAIKTLDARVKVMPARSDWMGLTHASDLPLVRDRLSVFHNLEAKVFPAFFPMGTIRQTTLLQGGHIHRTVRVEWEAEGQHAAAVFQRLNPQIFPDPELMVENNRIIADHLEGKGYSKEVLRPIRTPEGAAVVWAGDHPWRAFPFLSNTYTRLFPTVPEEVYQSAAAVGEWHSFLRDLDPQQIRPAIPGFFDVEKRWKQWETASGNALPDRLEKAGSAIVELESHRGLVDRFLDLQKENTLPLRILHGDPKLSNLLFDEQTHEVRALIDWDTVQPGWIVFDFGDMVRAYANPCAEDEPDLEKVTIHRPYMEALIDGFLSQMGHWLTPAEREHIFLGARWVIWIQALRFLADYLVGDKYYPVQYESHNLVRARNQLRLLECL